MLDVYTQVYHFDAPPFRLSPDYRYLYPHHSCDQARAYLKYALMEGEGIVVVTGGPGTGKTTLIASMLAENDPAVTEIGLISHLHPGVKSLYADVAAAFGLDPETDEDEDIIKRIGKKCAESMDQGRRSVLVIDEAQGLSEHLLEEVRLLSNIRHDSQQAILIILVGHRSLMDVIRRSEMEQFHQRLIATAHLEPLGQDETREYIEHRLKVSGWTGDPAISDEVVGLIYKFSEGIPRRINLICHRLFLRGGLDECHSFDGPDALHVIVELHKEGLLMPVSRRNLNKVNASELAEAC